MSYIRSRSVLFRQLLIGLGLIGVLPLLIAGGMVWLLGPKVLMPVLLTCALTVAAIGPLAARWLSEPISRLIEQMVALAEGDFQHVIPSVRSAEQRLALDAAAGRRAAGVVLAPIDPYTMAESTARTAAAGIPVITVGARLASDDCVTAHIAADGYAAALLAARALVELIEKRGKVALLVASAELPEALAREQGFRDGLSAYPEIEIVAVYPYDSDTRRAQAHADQVLQRWPDLAAIVATSEDGTIGALEAARARRRTEGVRIVGWNVTPELVGALEQGQVDLLVAEDPYRLGYTCIHTVVAKLQGRPLPRTADVPVTLIRRDDLRRPEVQELLSTHERHLGLPLLPRFDPPREISVIAKRSDLPYFRMMRLGALRAAADMGVVVRWESGKGEVDLDELGDLGRVFNRLLRHARAAQERMAQVNEELEQQVALRTADLERSMAALAEQAGRQERLLATIRALANPIIPVAAGVIVMPLVGELDDERVQDLRVAMLEGIGQHGARAVIIDITGVGIIDSVVAAQLLATTKAARLLGAYAMLTGIRPEIAQTITQLGINLEGLDTRRDLQEGIRSALRRIPSSAAAGRVTN
jgi:ABC-type sugar transport system substrate-binding protein/anti-anti-sigma regulatory factor